MTPRRPIELVNADKACFEAWAKRDQMLDDGDKIGVQAMNLACKILGNRHMVIYREWQILGGTSDIESIALFGTEAIAADDADWKDEQATRESVRPF